MAGVTEQLRQLRRAVPVALIPGIVERRIERIWQVPEFRQAAEGQMEFLLGKSERADEVPVLARAYAEQMLLRSYLRFHPRAITRQPVRGIEHLTTGRDPDRGVLLSFAHHHRYDGMFASIARHGVDMTAVMLPEMLRPDAHIDHRQHRNVCLKGTKLISSDLGSEGIAAHLRPGSILALAPDVPGRTPVTFLGRRVLGSFGSARLAASTDSVVVVVTSHREGDGNYLQLHAPLDPRHVADAGELLEEILRIHGEAILAWPEALESPHGRFGVLEEDG